MRHQVDVEAGAPVCVRRRSRAGGAVAEGDASVGHKHANRAQFAFGALDRGDDLPFLRHVDRQSQAVDVGGYPPRARVVEVGDRDPRARCAQGPAQGPADAARAAGDQRHGAVQFHQVFPLIRAC
jgi:hypothetical protein